VGKVVFSSRLLTVPSGLWLSGKTAAPPGVSPTSQQGSDVKQIRNARATRTQRRTMTTYTAADRQETR
jgi:hypothetical protein